MLRTELLLVGLLKVSLACAALGCSGEDEGRSGVREPSGSGGGSGGSIDPSVGGGLNGNPGNGAGGDAGPYMLPEGYTAAEKGGWKLGDVLTPESGSGPVGDACKGEILGVVRDFRRGDQGHPQGHPDFQTFYGSVANVGLVEPLLVSQKPVYSGTGHLGAPPEKQMTSEAHFLQWYNTDDDPTEANRMNVAYEIYFSLEPNGAVRTFESNAFYPLNGHGFGSEAPFVVNEGLPDEMVFGEQNFHFTTEVHTKFRYNGGEVFSFTGDDDLWVFINGRLALDLGGLHPSLEGSVDLDGQANTLEVAVGGEYTLDLFHAERGMPESNFRIDTSLEFTVCNIIVR